MDNSFIKETNKILSADKLSHAYLIELSNYDTDYNLLYDFLCNILKKYNNEIDEEKLNILLKKHEYPDLIEIEPEGNVIKKNQILKLQEEFKNKSLYNNKKIYVIKDAEKMNLSSSNTILKFLEEPEDDIIAFLVTKNRYNLLDTIISRCQVLKIFSDNKEDCDYINDLFNMIFKYGDLFVNYDYLVEKYFFDRDSCIKTLDSLEKRLYLFLKNNNVNSEQISKIIIILEEERKYLEYNVNIKMWLDNLYSRMMGVIK